MVFCRLYDLHLSLIKLNPNLILVSSLGWVVVQG